MKDQDRINWVASLREGDVVAVLSEETGFVGLYRFVVHNPSVGDIAVCPMFSKTFNPTDQFERVGCYHAYLKLNMQGFACQADGSTLLRIEPVDESVGQRLAYRFLAKAMTGRAHDRVLMCGRSTGEGGLSMPRVRKMALAMDIIHDNEGWRLKIPVDEEGRLA